MLATAKQDFILGFSNIEVLEEDQNEGNLGEECQS